MRRCGRRARVRNCAYSASHTRPAANDTREPMADPDELAEIEQRIAILRDNLRELVEQAAAYSGAADEARNADRIANQQARLDELLKEREKLAKS
jgi:predicted RNA-binding protein